VDTKAIATILNPEYYFYRVPRPWPVRTAVARQVSTYNVSVNAAGNAGIYIHPYNVFGLGTVNEMLSVMNAADFNPNTGFGSVTAYNGMFYANRDNVSNFYLNAFSV